MHKNAAIILFQKGLMRSGPVFKMEYITFRTSKTRTAFNPDFFWFVANVLTIKQTGTLLRTLKKHNEKFYKYVLLLTI